MLMRYAQFFAYLTETISLLSECDRHLRQFFPIFLNNLLDLLRRQVSPVQIEILC